MIINKNEYDVFKGLVQDEYLGLTYMGLYLTTDNKREQDEYLILSARCGYRQAQEICIKYGIRY